MSNVEYEKRFLVPTPDLISLKDKLIKKGAVEIGSYLQERIVFDVDDAEMRWGRLRTNGTNTTLAIKEKTDGGVTETEITVSEFEVAAKMLKMLGIVFNAQHQNYRKELEFEDENLTGKVAISFDAWPELFIRIGYILEIEASSEEDLLLAIAILGLNLENMIEQEVWDLYEDQGLDEILHRDLLFSVSELELLDI